jgi:hypothetical protein
MSFCPPVSSRVYVAYRFDRLLRILDDETGRAILDDLRHGTLPKRDHRRATGHRLDHHQPKRLRPIDRE